MDGVTVTNTPRCNSTHYHVFVLSHGQFQRSVDIYSVKIRQKQSRGETAASTNHFLNCAPGFVIVMSNSGSSTDYCLCVNDPS